ncbi:MAG TPA: DUF885 domain-containing protein [Actinophytocola sp.]|uniref:DUF885 domain-containing protein n=1 Tax=Actinophytocola sp. TaxID=1872138 RepID=UPI002DDD28AE|nr:DUF885 domain-containing protein [Actinophytocola sp.]HEV2782966.1 DUF885 domain-containing protein [Actinophytocola sp.]
MASVENGVHPISDRYVEDYAALDPIVATFQGIIGHDDQLPDLSPDGHLARAELAAGALRAMAAAEPADDAERTAKAVFAERIGLEVELHDAGLPAAALNVIESPPQIIRQVFDLMPADTEEHWAAIAARLTAVPDALAGYRTSLLHSADRGVVSALRQVERTAEQCDVWSGVNGGTSFFTTLVAAADGVDDVLRAELEAGAQAASKAYAALATFLREEVAPRAPIEDAVGAERYRLWSRLYLGAEIDLAEAYEWGWAEFTRLETEMRQVSGRISAGGSPAEAAAQLDADPRYRLSGQRALVEWMQRLSDQALADLRDVHFEIPDELMRLDCRIAPPGGSVGAYYTSPTDNFGRPGTMWWSVPADREEFLTWRETSTVYHEGAPGHHLQVATAVYESARLNRFQRLLAWVPGYGEGWALYAERLMREFGYLDDDGDLLGMLDAHLFRAARVIIDIGMHLKLPIPAGTGFHEGETWTPELGLEFMITRTLTEPVYARDEVDRYLGWPGQAPAYKLGERLWLAARDGVRARHGAEFDLKRFHMDALRMGPMGLDTLKERLATL